MSEVRLPRQARQQLQAAERIEQNIADSLNSPNTVSLEVATAQAAQAEQVLETAQNPAPVPAPQPAEATRPAEDIEQKYRTLQGKYNAEVPRLQQQLNNAVRDRDDTGNRLTQLEAELRQLRDRPQTQTLDPKDVESFGADLVEMVRRQANAEIERAVKGHLSEITTRIGQLEQSVTGVSRATANSAEQQFYANLKQMVPDYETVNVTPKFLEWLGEEDPVYGEPRQSALDRAASSLNAGRAAAVFNAFKQIAPAQAPAPANDLQSQVTPARTGATMAPQANTLRISEKSITQFYDDIRRGVYRGREAEAQRMEVEINRALAEGRVA